MQDYILHVRVIYASSKPFAYVGILLWNYYSVCENCCSSNCDRIFWALLLASMISEFRKFHEMRAAEERERKRRAEEELIKGEEEELRQRRIR